MKPEQSQLLSARKRRRAIVGTDPGVRAIKEAGQGDFVLTCDWCGQEYRSIVKWATAHWCSRKCEYEDGRAAAELEARKRARAIELEGKL